MKQKIDEAISSRTSKKSGDLLAYQVVEHAAKKGSKYITSGRKDYWKFFVASLGGGLIVAIFALIKLLLKSPEVPLGLEAIMFGVNYSVCFIIIYLTGSALATKQPAMTANTLARSLARDENRDSSRAAGRFNCAGMAKPIYIFLLAT